MPGHKSHITSVNRRLSNLDGSKHHAFMVIETHDCLYRLEANQFNLFSQKLRNGISNSLRKFNGSILKQNDNSHFIRFESASNAIMCALKIRSNFKYITPKFDRSIRQLNIGIAVSNSHLSDDKTITAATRMCDIVKEQIVASSAIETLYNMENKHARIDKTSIRVLKPSEEQFLNKLMDYIRTVWSDPTFISTDLSENLGYSKSQIYRKIKRLTGKTPTAFIRDFRLNEALGFIHNRSDIISEIALKIGFRNPTYFTKCFKDRFNILPSKYLQQHT